MSKVRAISDSFVGTPSGGPRWLPSGEELDANDALVLAHPALFEAVPGEPKRPILRRGAKDADA